MYDVILLGSGPAGLTAGIYSVRAGHKTLLIAGTKWGGQLMLTTLVENFPGFPEGIQGPQLMINMRKQAERLGVEIVNADFSTSDFSKQPFEVTAGGKTYQGKSVIIATGADSLWLNVPGEKELRGKGISVCATCDAFFFRGKNIAVIGGGDSAMEEAEVLSHVANSVAIIHRKDSFRASKAMQEKVFVNPKIRVIWNKTITKYLGTDKLTGLMLKDVKTGKEEEFKTDGVFLAIGHKPNSTLFKGLELDAKGYIKKISNIQFPISNFTWFNKDNQGKDWKEMVIKYPSLSSIEGVFVGGDVADYRYKQAITSAGFG